MISEEIEAGGGQLLASPCDHGLEGVIAKRRSAPYRSGRLGDWVKIKWVQSESFVIVGYERSTAARAGIGRLLLTARKRTKVVYVGGVETGFSERTAHELRDKLDGLNIRKAKAHRLRRSAALLPPVRAPLCTNSRRLMMLLPSKPFVNFDVVGQGEGRRSNL
ncbi:hypothetical protein [Rhizobium redzepovicii]|uniref:ATP dependent DNA ligase n=1 Tax=Rhizobium TaxID=379 RepID=UPI003CCE874C